MAEKKFRVWNKTIYPKFIKSTIFSLDNTGWINITKETNGGIDQYAGFKDRKGTEIYERDIIKYTNEEANGGVYELPEIKFENFDELMGFTDDEWKEDDRYTNIEVIGNMIESPELLANKK